MLQDELYIKLNKTWKEKFSQKNLSALSSCTLFNHAPLSASAPHCLLMKDFSDLRVAHDDFHWLCVAQPSRDSEGNPRAAEKRGEKLLSTNFPNEHKKSQFSLLLTVGGWIWMIFSCSESSQPASTRENDDWAQLRFIIESRLKLRHLSTEAQMYIIVICRSFNWSHLKRKQHVEASQTHHCLDGRFAASFGIRWE